MQANEKFRAGVGCDPDNNGGAATVQPEVLPVYAASPRLEIGRVLNHPCTWILVGFAAGIWFSSYLNNRN